MTTGQVRVGAWYPTPAPALPGEDSAAYTNRLAGIGGSSPYDHKRNRQCSIGWHLECTGGSCECPHHLDMPMLEADAMSEAGLKEIPRTLSDLYGLPWVSALNVAWLGYTAFRDTSGGEGYTAAVKDRLVERYGVAGDDFVTDVVNVVRDLASKASPPGGA